MSRKYDKNEYVNVHSEFGSQFIGIGRILGWQYNRENKTYDYLVLNIENGRKGCFEEGHLVNLKINLAREPEAKMTVFYEALNTASLDVSFDHNDRKKTYTLVGKDLEKAKQLFNEIQNLGTVTGAVFQVACAETIKEIY